MEVTGQAYALDTPIAQGNRDPKTSWVGGWVSPKTNRHSGKRERPATTGSYAHNWSHYGVMVI